MIGIFNETNRKRVDKINEILIMIQKSITSNKASSEDAWELLGSVVSHLEEMLGEAPETPSQTLVDADMVEMEERVMAMPETAHAMSKAMDKEPLRITIKRMAEEAPLKDLTTAMAVYLNRIDEALS